MADNAADLLNDWLVQNIEGQPFQDEETIEYLIPLFFKWVEVNYGLGPDDYAELGIDVNAKFEEYYHQILNAGG